MKRKRALMPREAVPLWDFFYTTTPSTTTTIKSSTTPTRKINRIMRQQKQQQQQQQQFNKSQYLFYFLLIFLWLPGVIVCDENNNGENKNGYNQESILSTTEIDPASRGSKKLGDRCQTTVECGIVGSICHAQKKICKCTYGLTATNNNDKCGRVTGLNESCTFNEQCSIADTFSECRDGKCLCRFEWIAVLHLDGRVECKEFTSQGTKKYGDKCESTQECSFAGSVCDPKMKACQCSSDLSATNQIDKCGKVAAVNESCFFHEQCTELTHQTECRDNRCICMHQLTPIGNKDGKIECKVVIEEPKSTRYINPAMIGALVAMALMFIIICVVLRLFSRARWHDNRTIFNTPNPRLMNVSLLRDNKLLHGHERRGSKMSVRAPSRQPSMASLRPHSPNPSIGSRRGSRGSSNASGNSMRSSRSLNGTHCGGLHEQKPLNLAHVPESVTVEITEPKA